MKMIYIKSDFKRAFSLKRFLIGSFGVMLIMFFSIYHMTDITSVYTAYTDAIYFIPFMMAMTFCAIPFGGSINEDVEYQYISFMLIRGSAKKYVVSKVIMIYISAIFTMLMGVFCFSILIKYQVSWGGTDIAEDALLNILGGSTCGLLYFMIHAVYMGLLAANLVLLSAFVSIFWANKLLIISLPFMAYYLLIYYSMEIFPEFPQLNIKYMFNPSFNTWNNEVLSFIFPFLFSGIVAGGLGICMYRQVRKRYGR